MNNIRHRIEYLRLRNKLLHEEKICPEFGYPLIQMTLNFECIIFLFEFHITR